MNTNRFYADALDAVFVRNGVVHLVFATRDVDMLQSENLVPGENPIKHCVTMPVPAMLHMVQLMIRLSSEQWVAEGLKNIEEQQNMSEEGVKNITKQ